MKLFHIVTAHPILNKIAGKDLPIKTAVKLSKTLQELEPVLNIYNDKRMGLFKKYGQEMKDQPGQLEVKEENLEKFNKEMEKLMNSDVEVKIIQIEVDDLSDEVKLSTAEVLQIGWLFDANHAALKPEKSNGKSKQATK